MISSYCTLGTCVQVTPLLGGVFVGSTAREGSVWFSADEWAAFLAGVKTGEFDLEVLRGAERLPEAVGAPGVRGQRPDTADAVADESGARMGQPTSGAAR